MWHNTLTHLSVDIDGICGWPIDFQLRLAIFRDLSHKWDWVSNVLIFVWHFNVKEADGLFRRWTDGLGGLKVFTWGLKVLLVARWVKILVRKSRKIRIFTRDRAETEVKLTWKSITTGLVMSGSIWSKLVRSSKSSSSLDVVDGVGVGSLSNLNEIWRASKLLCFLAWNDFLVWSNSSSDDDVPLSNRSSCFDDFTSSEACFFDW